MGLDGAGTDEQDVGDLRVGEPTRQETQNLHAHAGSGQLDERCLQLRRELRRERVDVCERWRRPERVADGADLVQEADVSPPSGRLPGADCAKASSVSARSKGVSQAVARSRAVVRCASAASVFVGCRLDLTEEAVGGQATSG